MITLLGVGHVFDLGASIRTAIQTRAPKVVALELDPARFAYLMNRQPRSSRASVIGLLAGGLGQPPGGWRARAPRAGSDG